MRTVFILLAIGFAATPAWAQYSDASLDGAWNLVINVAIPGDPIRYIVFDGQGTIDDLGANNVPDPAGSYSVAPAGELSGQIWADQWVDFGGQMLSDTSATIEVYFDPDTLVIPMFKVADESLCAGNWSGTFQDFCAGEFTVTLEIDAEGRITFASGFPDGAVGGGFYFDSYLFAGHVHATRDTNSAGGDVGIEFGSIVDDSMAGWYNHDQDGPGAMRGRFELQRGTTGIKPNSGDEAVGPEPHPILESALPNPAGFGTTLHYSLSEPTEVSLHVFDVRGRHVITLKSHEPTEAGSHEAFWDGRSESGIEVPSGQYYYQLVTDQGEVARKVIVLR